MSSQSLRLLPSSQRARRGYRFGFFELEIRSGELRKNGIRLRLRKQSVQILLMLLENPGEVVLRDEIRQRLWPDNTVVEFDHGINTAMQRLRDVLGDSPEKPRWIETLAGRGYRFIEPVEILDSPSVAVTKVEGGADSQRGIQSAAQPDRRLPWLAAGAVTGFSILVLAGWLLFRISPSSSENWVLAAGPLGDTVSSPDGSALLYRDHGNLFLRRRDSLAAVEVYRKSFLMDRPAWSPDGTQALFQTMSGLIRTPIPHGPSVNLWPNRRVTRGYSWGPDGTLIVAVQSNGTSDLYLLAAEGGVPRRIDIPQLRDGLFHDPEFLPENGKFLFTWAGYGDEEAGIYLARMSHGKLEGAPRLLRRNITAGHFGKAGGGYLLYVQNDNLYAQALDQKSGTLEGEPRRVAGNVFSALEVRRAFFSVSRAGLLTWRSGNAGLVQLTWFDRRGRVAGTAGPLCEPSRILLSPDERHLLLTIGDQFAGLLDPHQSTYQRLPGMIRGAWTPDSEHILNRVPGTEILQERDLALGKVREVATIPGLVAVHDVSPDGKSLLYSSDQGLNSIRLDELPGRRRAEMVVAGDQTHAHFSPDGRWIVYAAVIPAANRQEIFIKPFRFAGLSKQISMDGGTSPVWRGDGQEILYRNGNKIYSVRVKPVGNQMAVATPEGLFAVHVPASLVGDSIPLAVVRDGSRILFAEAQEGSTSDTTYVMTDWSRALIVQPR